MGHDPVQFTQEFWDDRYRSAGRLWSGQPNPQLVAQIADLAPGEALEAGCGEGADAIWLARQGWTVTAVDVSAVALERAAGYAAAAGDEIARRITWQREDLCPGSRGRSGSTWCRRSSCTPPRASSRRCTGGWRRRSGPAGRCSWWAHHPDDLHANVGRTGPADRFWSAQDIAASLDPGSWEVIVADAPGRSATDLDGRPVMVRDTVLRARRS